MTDDTNNLPAGCTRAGRAAKVGLELVKNVSRHQRLLRCGGRSKIW